MRLHLGRSLTRAARRAVVESLENRRLLSVAPAGGEFSVNLHTPDHQVAPRVAVDADGNFVIVWVSRNQEGPGTNDGIYMRHFAADGTPLSGEIHVNTYTTAAQLRPAIAMDDAGNFVVVWDSFGQDGMFSGIFAQRYDSSGAPVGSEFQVNTFTGSDEAFASVAMDADGDFVVTWDTTNPSGSAYDVYAQRYNSTGQPVGGEFLVNSTTVGEQYNSAVAMDDAGNFVVSWIAGGQGAQDGSGYGIYARRYNAAGVPQGAEFRVNTHTTGDQFFPSIAMDADGDFVIAWQSPNQDGSSTGIFAQRFNASAVAQGIEFQVNTYTTFAQEGASVGMDMAGNFIISWESFGQDGNFLTVAARAFRANGTPVGNDFQVNTFTTDDQQFPSVGMRPSGDTVIAWQSFQDGSENGIYAQRYDVDLIAPTVDVSNFRYQTAPHALMFTFSEDVSASLSLADIQVTKLPGGPIVNPTGFSYDSGTNTATFTFATILDDGNYQATLFAAGITDAAGNSLAADHNFDFFFLLGDADHNRVVNLLDFNILAANFGQMPRDFTQADFNYDTIVNLNDFNILASRFGQSVAPSVGSRASAFSTGPIRGAAARDQDDPVMQLLS